MFGGFLFIVWAFALTLLIPFLYQFAVEATRVSPLRPLTVDSVVQTALATAQVIVIPAVALALLVALAGLLWSALRPAADEGPAPRRLVAAAAVVLLAIGLLPAIENFSYIVIGSSLKTSTSLERKLAMALIALTLAGAFVRPLLWLAERMGRSRILGALLIVTCAAAFGSTAIAIERRLGDGGVEHLTSPYNVLILSSDGVDANRMSVYGYKRQTTPFLEKIAPELWIFRNAFTNNGNTTGSVTSLLTGRLPLRTRVIYPPDLLIGEDSLLHLPGILGAHGYYRSNWGVPHYADVTSQNFIDAIDVNAGVSTSENIANALPVNDRGLGGWFVRRTVADIEALTLDILGIREAPNPYDQIVGSGASLTDDRRLNGVLENIAQDRPFFTHVHFMGTHGPYFKPRNRVFSAGTEQSVNFQSSFLDDAILDYDQRIQRVYEALEQSGKLENTILIITSDHGMLYIPSTRIPLLIRLPGKMRTGEVHENVQRMDLAPTILSLLQLPIPDWMEGQNLLEPVPPDRIILVTNVVVEKPDENGWLPPFVERNRVTAIYCDVFLGYSLTMEPQASGHIEGSTSPCTVENPEAVRGMVGGYLAKTLAELGIGS